MTVGRRFIVFRSMNPDGEHIATGPPCEAVSHLFRVVAKHGSCLGFKLARQSRERFIGVIAIFARLQVGLSFVESGQELHAIALLPFPQ